MDATKSTVYRPNPTEEDTHPHVCNDGWVSIAVEILDPDTGEEILEEALYLCRRCADAK